MSDRTSWLDRLASEAKRLSADVERKVREAADSPAGQQVKKAVIDLGQQTRKAVDEVAPRVKSAYGQVAPEVKRVYEQVAPEVKKAVDEAVAATTKTVNDLVGRTGGAPAGARDTATSDSGTPPNVSPEAYRTPSPEEPKQGSSRFEPAGEPDEPDDEPDDADTPVEVPPRRASKPKSSGKRPRKPSGGKGK